QDVGGRDALAGTLRWRRVSSARLESDGQAHLLDRRSKVARDIDGKRLERRDVECIDCRPCTSLRSNATAREIDKARQETGERLASAGGRNEKRVAALGDLCEQFELMGMRVPAARAEPAGERRWQRRLRHIQRQACTRTHVVKVLLDLAFGPHQFWLSFESKLTITMRLASSGLAKEESVDGTVLWRESGSRSDQARDPVAGRGGGARRSRFQPLRSPRQPAAARRPHLRHGLRRNREVAPLLPARRGDRISGMARGARVQADGTNQRRRGARPAIATAKPRALVPI